MAIYTDALQQFYLLTVYVEKCEINNEPTLQPGDMRQNSMFSLRSSRTWYTASCFSTPTQAFHTAVPYSPSLLRFMMFIENALLCII